MLFRESLLVWLSRTYHSIFFVSHSYIMGAHLFYKSTSICCEKYSLIFLRYGELGAGLF